MEGSGRCGKTSGSTWVYLMRLKMSRLGRSRRCGGMEEQALLFQALCVLYHGAVHAQ